MSDASQFDPYAMPPGGIVDPPQSLWAALRKIGPGIILAGSIIGSGELLLTTALGAEYGFAFLWLIVFSCIVKVFVQIELGRYAISSGKPTLGALNELPGPRWRVHWLVWWWFIMLLATVSQLGAMIGGVAQALNLAFPGTAEWLARMIKPVSLGAANSILGHPEYPWAVVTAFSAVGLLLIGGYKSIERITTVMVAAVTGITVLCVAILPANGFPFRIEDIVTGFTLFTHTDAGWKFAIPAAGIAAAFGAFGITGVGASELYSYPYWCLEKGYARFVGQHSDDDAWARRAKGWLRVMHLDAWVSMLVFTTATVAFYFLGATVLYRQGLLPEKSKMIETLAEMYVPTFGNWTRIAFLIGAWAVLFKTLYVATASNSRLTADFLSLGRFLNFDSAEPRRVCIQRLCVFYPIFGMLLYFGFRDPRAMVIFGGFFQAATLPVISAAAVYMRYRRTDKRIAPSKLSDICLWLAFVSITIVAGYAIRDWALTQLWPAVRERFAG